MFLLLFFVVSSVFAINNIEKEYFSIQEDELITSSELELISLKSGAGDWPSFIYYSQDINNTTGLDVSIGFSEANNTLYYDYELVRGMDICEVLNTAIADPKSPQAQFMIPELIGLYGVRCPIKQGIRNLNPYQFPTLSFLLDIGTGSKNFIVRITDRNNDNIPLITLITQVKMKYWDSKERAVVESSSPSQSTLLPNLLGFSMTIITFLVTK